MCDILCIIPQRVPLWNRHAIRRKGHWKLCFQFFKSDCFKYNVNRLGLEFWDGKFEFAFVKILLFSFTRCFFILSSNLEPVSRASSCFFKQNTFQIIIFENLYYDNSIKQQWRIRVGNVPPPGKIRGGWNVPTPWKN